MSDEVEEGENKHPNKVDKVPVKAHFFDHLVVLAAFHDAVEHHQKHHQIDDHTGEHVESVKPGDEEEEVAVSLLGGILTVVNASPVCTQTWGRLGRSVGKRCRVIDVSHFHRMAL